MKCNAQPCESCWLAADLKLLCPHSLRSSRSPSPSRSLPGSNGYAPGRTLLYNGTPFQTVDVQTSDGFARSRQRYSSPGHRFLHRTALRVPFLVQIFGCCSFIWFSSPRALRPPSCRVPPSSMWWSLSHPTVGCIYSHPSRYHPLRSWNSSTAGESG